MYIKTFKKAKTSKITTKAALGQISFEQSFLKYKIYDLFTGINTNITFISIQLG